MLRITGERHHRHCYATPLLGFIVYYSYAYNSADYQNYVVFLLVAKLFDYTELPWLPRDQNNVRITSG